MLIKLVIILPPKKVRIEHCWDMANQSGAVWHKEIHQLPQGMPPQTIQF